MNNLRPCGAERTASHRKEADRGGPTTNGTANLHI